MFVILVNGCTVFFFSRKQYILHELEEIEAWIHNVELHVMIEPYRCDNSRNVSQQTSEKGVCYLLS